MSETESTVQVFCRCHAEGWRAWREGRNKDENPYEAPAMRKWWLEGFEDSAAIAREGK